MTFSLLYRDGASYNIKLSERVVIFLFVSGDHRSARYTGKIWDEKDIGTNERVVITELPIFRKIFKFSVVNNQTAPFCFYRSSNNYLINSKLPEYC